MRRSPLLIQSLTILALALWVASPSPFIASQGAEIPLTRRELIKSLGGFQPSGARLLGFASPGKNQRFHRPTQSVSRIIQDTARSRSDYLASRAALDLVSGKFREAVDLLEMAYDLEPSNHLILNDLSAAYLLSGYRDRKPLDFIKALSLADRALRLNPESPESSFNRAMALDALCLREKAAGAWINYLDIDPSSIWSLEAKQRLAKLQGPSEVELWQRAESLLKTKALNGDHPALIEIVRRFPQQARLYAENAALPEWAQALSNGRALDANKSLMVARRVGEILAVSNEDRMLSDSVRLIDRAQSNPSMLSMLVDGHLAYGLAYQAHLRHDSVTASRLFKRSSEALAQTQSPFQAWAQFYLAVCDIDGSDYSSIIESLQHLKRSVDPSRYPSLIARVDWILGMAWFRQSKPSLALVPLSNALHIFQRMGNLEDAGAIQYLIAAPLFYMGNREEGWRHLYQSLAALEHSINSWRIFSVYDEVANAAMSDGEPAAALYFRDLLVQTARGASDEVGLCHALLRRAETFDRLRDKQRALADLEDSARQAERISDPNLRRRSLAAIHLAKGEMLALSRPDEALEALAEALAYFKDVNQFEIPRIYLARFQAHRTAGDEALAGLDLEEGIREYERVRKEIGDQELRISYFEQAQGLFDQMITLADRAGNTALAFEYAERSRARVLKDLLGAAGNPVSAGSGRGSESLASLGSQIPQNVSLIVYSALSSHCVVWVVRSDGIETLRLNIDINDLQKIVKSVRKAVSQYAGEREYLRDALAAGFDAIIRPILGFIKKDDILIFIPDKDLHILPFGALRDEALGHFLIEDHPIAISPSVDFFLRSLGREKKGRGSAPRLLAIGDPEINRTIFPELTSLAAAGAELDELAELYPDSEVLDKKRATRSAFMDSIGRFEIVHVATHAAVNRDAPLLSTMAFSPDKIGDDGILYAKDLYSKSLGRTKLVVLAACETGVGRVPELEGALSLARPFLAGGVPAVVASLWRVSDESSQRLLLDFHRSIKRGESVARALQYAQVNALKRGGRWGSINSWAGFEVFGTVAVANKTLLTG